MNRRDFIKIMGAVGAVLSVPVKVFSRSRKAEKAFEVLGEAVNVSEVVADVSHCSGGDLTMNGYSFPIREFNLIEGAGGEFDGVGFVKPPGWHRVEVEFYCDSESTVPVIAESVRVQILDGRNRQFNFMGRVIESEVSVQIHDSDVILMSIVFRCAGDVTISHRRVKVAKRRVG